MKAPGCNVDYSRSRLVQEFKSLRKVLSCSAFWSSLLTRAHCLQASNSCVQPDLPACQLELLPSATPLCLTRYDICHPRESFLRFDLTSKQFAEQLTQPHPYLQEFRDPSLQSTNRLPAPTDKRGSEPQSPGLVKALAPADIPVSSALIPGPCRLGYTYWSRQR